MQMMGLSKKIIILVFVLLWSSTFFNFFAIGKEFQNYTDLELNALRQFRPLVKNMLTHDYMHKHVFLIRWFREHNLEIIPAVADLKKYLEFRKKNDIDNILNLNMRGHSKHLPIRMEGYDRQERPILEILWGKWDLRKYGLAGKRDEMRQYYHYIFEKLLVKLRQTQEETGRDIDQYYAMGDLDGFSATSHLCVPCWPIIYDCIQTHAFGGSVFARNLTIVNTPRIFSPIITAMKQVFSTGLFEKLNILDQDQNSDHWKKELAKHIAPDQLPPRLGGTNKNFS